MKTIASLLVLLTTQAYAADVPTPKTAARGAPFVNSMGMKFVPVEITGGPTKGKRVLFSIWDTRVQEYSQYASATGIVREKPSFEQGATHPAVMVKWGDAQSFCAWLSNKDGAAGLLGTHDRYRLPTDHEWSCAVGIGALEHLKTTPRSKSPPSNVYPWGTAWPPPSGAGNYHPRLRVDGFANTSPVGYFAPNQYGLYDMGGNVRQWCEDWYSSEHVSRILRGSSWSDDVEFWLQSQFRGNEAPNAAQPTIGFRCVLFLPDD